MNNRVNNFQLHYYGIFCLLAFLLADNAQAADSSQTVNILEPSIADEFKQAQAIMSDRLDRVEDIEAIRRLQHTYGYFMDYCRYDDVIDLFAEDGEVIFLSGVYKGHDGLARMYKILLGQVYTKGKTGPLYGFIADHHMMQDVITVSKDRKTAKLRGRCYLTLGSHETRPDMPDHLPQQIYEAGLYENTYVRDNGVWKIQRLQYVLQWQSLYEKGWAHTATDPALRPATQTYPENPIGPDYILKEKQGLWPERTPLEFHYVHPVTGKPLN